MFSQLSKQLVIGWIIATVYKHFQRAKEKCITNQMDDKTVSIANEYYSEMDFNYALI